MEKIQPKILYIYLSFFSESQKASGWAADSFIREHLSSQGMGLINGARDDDLFLLLDADELPMVEPLLFLKLYDGFGEPIQWGFR